MRTEALVPVFDETASYEGRVRPRVDGLLRACKKLKVPGLMSFCVASDGEKATVRTTFVFRRGRNLAWAPRQLRVAESIITNGLIGTMVGSGMGLLGDGPKGGPQRYDEVERFEEVAGEEVAGLFDVCKDLGVPFLSAFCVLASEDGVGMSLSACTRESVVDGHWMPDELGAAVSWLKEGMGGRPRGAGDDDGPGDSDSGDSGDSGDSPAPGSFEFTPPDPKCRGCGRRKSAHSGVGAFVRPLEAMPRHGLAPHPAVPLGRYEEVRSGTPCVVTGGILDASGLDGADVLVAYGPVGGRFSCCRGVEEFLRRFRRAGGGGS